MSPTITFKESRLKTQFLLESRNKAYRVLVGKPEEKTAVGRSRHKWEDSIRMDRREIG
jgi:hypothetical protein